MDWYEDLYVGQEAEKNQSRIISKLKKHRILKNVFVITPASNGYDLFDIYPANVLRQKYFRQKNIFVIGIAVGHNEAVSLVEKIVKELYCERGIKNLREYFNEAMLEGM